MHYTWDGMKHNNVKPLFAVLLLCFTLHAPFSSTLIPELWKKTYVQSWSRRGLTEHWASSLQQHDAAEASSDRSLDGGRQLILPPSRESTSDVGHSSEALKNMAAMIGLPWIAKGQVIIFGTAMLAYSRAEFGRRHQRPLAALAALGRNNRRD